MCLAVTVVSWKCVCLCVREGIMEVNLYMQAFVLSASIFVCATQADYAFWFSCVNRQLLHQSCSGCIMKDADPLSSLLCSDREGQHTAVIHNPNSFTLSLSVFVLSSLSYFFSFSSIPICFYLSVFESQQFFTLIPYWCSKLNNWNFSLVW